MKNTKLFIVTLLIFSAFGCSKESTTAAPDPTADIMDKWWCDQAKKVASQYFKADGSWEQGSKGGRFNDTGKWALSADKKKIVISSVLDSSKKAKTGWEYDITSASSTKLLMNFTALNVTMDMPVCP